MKNVVFFWEKITHRKLIYILILHNISKKFLEIKVKRIKINLINFLNQVHILDFPLHSILNFEFIKKLPHKIFILIQK